jgi:indole-3-glycerol phosphate synthase
MLNSKDNRQAKELSMIKFHLWKLFEYEKIGASGISILTDKDFLEEVLKIF